jgi:hypothetical protein
MAAATVNIPAIVMNVGPMLNGEGTIEALLMSRLRRQTTSRIWYTPMGRSSCPGRREDQSRAAHQTGRYFSSKVREICLWQHSGTESLVSVTAILWVLRAQ